MTFILFNISEAGDFYNDLLLQNKMHCNNLLFILLRVDNPDPINTYT